MTRIEQSQLDVLIVEDDALLRKVMSLQLKVAGFPVRTAGSGRKALEMIKEQVPAVLILDVGLPDMTPLILWSSCAEIQRLVHFP